MGEPHAQKISPVLHNSFNWNNDQVGEEMQMNLWIDTTKTKLNPIIKDIKI